VQFREFFSEIKPYVGVIEEMQHYNRTDVVGIGAGTTVPPTLFEWAGGAKAFDTRPEFRSAFVAYIEWGTRIA
jgi:hypothetical protein